LRDNPRDQPSNPFFADMLLAKAVLASLLSDKTLNRMRVRAFTLMPDHLHFLAGVRQPEFYLPELIGRFKSYTTQQYWKRSREVVDSDAVSLPSALATKTEPREARELLTSIMQWRATIRPEVVELKNWPRLKPGQFLKKRLWQLRLFDHVIRNDTDLHDNLEYIAMNPVKAGYVSRPQFYPYTGFLV
jgi:REP element-mobilizing transposase RayT